MKRIFTLLITLILFGSISFGQSSSDVIDGVLKVKFKAEKSKQFDNLLGKSASAREIVADQKAGYVQTGIEGIDKLNQKYGVVKYTRIFRDAGINEAKHREYGLHLWYKIEFNTKAQPNELASEFKNSSDVEHANPEYKAQLTGLTDTKSLTGTPNDPNFSDQWHYENTGQNGGTAGDDISLLEAWTLETGSSNVIVAIEDGGVDWDHPDLAGNMWVNPGEIAGNNVDDDNNGYVDDIYGYNFGDDKGEIYVGDHGTHVAGTVAAETNNGIGVAGVAGGSGSNDGVRIMSCNVFAQSTGGFEEAYTYAADNGAVISQNSWGYTSKDVYDQSVLDAIDYFNAEAGSPSAPMDGGIVIFAAGNDGSSGQWWPGCYDNVLAVAATNCNDERSYYSNYDTWVDVAAPGGELISTNDDPTAIHSTYPNGAYGVMQGTSMACPHVSGVAALIISRFEGSITPQQVFDRIVDNADNIDSENPSYIGKLGSGRINAFASLGGSVVVDTEAPTTPSGLVSSNVTESSVALNWNAATDNIGVTGYDIYRNGSYLTTSSSTSYSVTGLSASTAYSFYVKAKDGAGNESGASNTVSITTSEIVAVYCDSKGTNFSYEWIDEVQIGSYTNASNAAGYTDFTSENIALEAGAAVSISLTPGFSNSSYNEYWKIWIDYNNDKDFDDANELAFDQGGMSSSTVNGIINVLSTASGTTRMRVSMKYNAAQTACETFTYGEVEDYTVTFGAAGPDTEDPTAPTGLSASNVTTSTATLNWNASTDNVGVTEYDLYRNGTLMASTSATNYNVTGLSASTTYSFYVKAKDAEGNISAASSTINVTTEDPADTQAPTAPTGLSSSSITETSFTLAWTASTDNVGVTGYDVYKNGSLLGSVTGTSASITGLTASTTYAMSVNAKDAAGNVSAASSTLNVTTLDPVGGGCTGGITSYPYSQGFEGSIGDWTQDSNDDIDWTVDASGTPSSSTGPSSADEGTYYLYVESSGSGTGYPNKVAIINSPCFDLTAESNANFNFAYHMYGSSMGTMELQASIDGTSWTTLWTKSGDQGNSWYNATVSLSSYYGSSVQLRYVATTASSYRSDFAIDDISLTTSTTNPTGTNLTLTITFDNYPEETSWTLKNNAGSTVASGGTYASQADGSTLVIPINDLEDDCYDFTILDSYGDGICCAYGSGSYTLEVTGGAVLASGGSFTSSEVTNFCLPATTSFTSTPLNVNDNINGKSTVNIYPNPASTFINVDVINGHRVGTIRIYNMVGTLVKTLEMNGSEKEVDISELPTGLYIISIEDEKEPLVKQFIKQ
ncbi:MAG: S8 family serine peptidase [Bacteroidales bacterium]|nr:S8 family serine peptidase [Bacteroidales bacterium]